MHIFGQLVHIFGELAHIFGKLVHIFARKLVSRTSKQVSKKLGSLWQPGVYNDTNLKCLILMVASAVKNPTMFMVILFCGQVFCGRAIQPLLRSEIVGIACVSITCLLAC